MYDTLIQIERVGDASVATVGNDLDLASTPVVERYIREAVADSDALVISLASCRFVDSTGIGALVRFARRFGSKFAVVVPQPSHIRRVFDVTGLGAHMHLVATVSEAVILVSKKALIA